MTHDDDDRNIKCEVMLVTPPMALDWLTLPRHVHRNRPLDAARIAIYAAAMRAGEWKLDGSAIKFSDTGGLLDGQNRLNAVLEADTAITTLVISGLADDAQDVMDSGKPRSAANVLHIHGFRNTTLVAAAARLLIGLETGALTAGHLGTVKVSNDAVLAFAEANPDIETVVAMTGIHPVVFAPGGAYVAAMVLLLRVDSDDASRFHAALSTGASLLAGDPILSLRERLMSARSRREKLSNYVYISSILRCWNAWRTGITLKTFVLYSPHGGGAVPIPANLK